MGHYAIAQGWVQDTRDVPQRAEVRMAQEQDARAPRQPQDRPCAVNLISAETGKPQRCGCAIRLNGAAGITQAEHVELEPMLAGELSHYPHCGLADAFDSPAARDLRQHRHEVMRLVRGHGLRAPGLLRGLGRWPGSWKRQPGPSATAASA